MPGASCEPSGQKSVTLAVPEPGPLGEARSYWPGGTDQVPYEPSVQVIRPTAWLNDTRAKASSWAPVCESPEVVYGIEISTDVAGELSVVVAVSVVSTLADCATSWFPRAWTETVAEPVGVPTELTEALP